VKHPIAIFAYDFPHRKTHDFLVDLCSYGVKNLVVLAAPKKKLLTQESGVYYSKSLRFCPALDTEKVCNNLDVPFFRVAHEESAQVGTIKNEHNIEMALVSGARIIPRDVIELFPEGVVNFNTGMIPQTSGLDAFYYTIKNAVNAGVTTHFIDHRVDAGDQIYFDEVRLTGAETPEVLAENVYQLQRVALRRLVEELRYGAVKSTAVDRPKKNEPMTPEEKAECIAAFPEWRAARFAEQREAT